MVPDEVTKHEHATEFWNERTHATRYQEEERSNEEEEAQRVFPNTAGPHYTALRSLTTLHYGDALQSFTTVHCGV